MSTLSLMDHVDEAFFSVDSDKMPQTIAAVCTLDGLPDWKRFQSEFSEALESFPRLRDKVVRKPRLAWQEDDHFELGSHFETIRAPHVSNHNDLFSEAGKIVSQRLDTTRPPWRIVQITNEKDLACVVICLHHGLADGMRLVRLLDAITSDSPTRSGMSSVEPEELANPQIKQGSRISHALRCSRKLLAESFAPHSPSPLNGNTSCERSITPVELPYRELTRMMRQVEGALHDVIYTIIAGTIQRYHASHGFRARNARIIIPMAVPPRSSKGGLGNHLVLSALTLPVSESNSLKRLEQVQAMFGRMKQDGTIGAYEFAAAAISRLVPTRFHRAAWETMLRKTNLVCTIMPGPERVRYLGGARINALFGIPAPVRGHGAAFAFVSYAGQLCGSIVTDNRVLPSANELVDCFTASYQEFLSDSTGGRDSIHPLLGQEVHTPNSDSIFEGCLDRTLEPFLGELTVRERDCVPAGALLEMLAAAASISRSSDRELVRPQVTIHDAVFHAPLGMSNNGCHPMVQTAVVREGPAWSIRISALGANEQWTPLAEAHHTPKSGIPMIPDVEIARLEMGCPDTVAPSVFYRLCRDLEIDYGPRLQVLKQLRRGPGQALAIVELPQGSGRSNAYCLHPVLLEGVLQTAAAASDLSGDAPRLSSLQRLAVYEKPSSTAWIHAHCCGDSTRARLHVQLLTTEGRCIAHFQDLCLSVGSDEPQLDSNLPGTTLEQEMRAASPASQPDLLREAVLQQVAGVLCWSTPAQIRPRDRLFDLGIDSMIAMELVSRLETQTGLSLPKTLMLDYPTIESLTDYLSSRMGLQTSVGTAAPPTGPVANEDVASLSEEELAELLAKELE